MISPTNLVKYFEGLHQRFRVDFIRVLLTHHLKEIFLFKTIKNTMNAKESIEEIDNTLKSDMPVVLYCKHIET